MTEPYSEEYETYLDTIQEIIDLQRAGEISDAVSLISANLEQHADKPELYLLTAVCSYRKNELAQAIELCEKAHEIAPDSQEVVDSLAVLKTITGNVTDGLYYAKLATVLDPHPDIPDLLPAEFSSFFHALNVASPSRRYLDGLYNFNGQLYGDACKDFEAELKLNPENIDALKMLGHTKLYLGDPAAAMNALSAYLEHNPDDADTVALMCQAKCQSMAFDAAADLGQQALDMPTASIETHMLVLEASMYFDGDLANVHIDFVQRLSTIIADPAKTASPEETRAPRDINAPIRLGMLSNDLRAGNQHVFALPMIEKLDKKVVDLTIYQQSPTGGPVFQEFKSKSPNWRRVVDVDDDVLSLIIARQKTDVLIDMCGFSSNARTVVCAADTAPIVTNLFCQPYGFGAPGVNVIIGDAATADTDRNNMASHQHFIETEGGLFAFAPPALLGDVKPLPRTDNGNITFGATFRPQAFSQATIDFWTKSLNAVDGARLLLGNVAAIPATQQAIVKASFGDFADRIAFSESIAYQETDPAFFGEVDIYLDSLPVNGLMDICHALWLGVPVITVTSNKRSGVLGASILTSAGHADWIAGSVDQGVTLAAGLAQDVDALKTMRAGLREQIKNSALMNIDSYTASMQQAFRAALDAVEA